MSKFRVDDRVVVPSVHPTAVWAVVLAEAPHWPPTYRLRPIDRAAAAMSTRVAGVHFAADELEYADEPEYAPPIQRAPGLLAYTEREAIEAAGRHADSIVPVDAVRHAKELLAKAKADKRAKDKLAKHAAKQQAALNGQLEAIRVKREAEQKAATERRDALTRYTNLALATTEALKQVKELDGFGGKPIPTPRLATFADELQALVGEFQCRVVTFNGLGVVARKEK